MKVILYDLETSANLGYTWAKYEQNVIKYKKEWELLSFAYKELHAKKVTTLTRADFKDKTDKSLVKALWNMLNKADIVVAHNGLSFDKRKGNAKFLQYGLKPPAPYKMIDTKRVAKQVGMFNSNSMDDLAATLGLPIRKLRLGEGFDLWEDAMEGNKTALKKMGKYNAQDVEVLEQLYLRLQPWIQNHPNVAPEAVEVCTHCGSTHLKSNGFRYTNTQAYRRLQCMGCGAHLRERATIKRTPKKVVGL